VARERHGLTVDYLADRLGGLVRLVPCSREVHLRLGFFERMLDDGLADMTRLFHDAEQLVDVWTLDAGTPGWQERLARAGAADADIVTTSTPRALAAAAETTGYAIPLNPREGDEWDALQGLAAEGGNHATLIGYESIGLYVRSAGEPINLDIRGGPGVSPATRAE
jgi:hypothetical protein